MPVSQADLIGRPHARRASGNRRIDQLPVNFSAGFIDNRDVEILVARVQLPPNCLCQPLAMGNCRPPIHKLQSNVIAGRNTVPDVEVIRSHCGLPWKSRYERR